MAFFKFGKREEGPQAQTSGPKPEEKKYDFGEPLVYDRSKSRTSQLSSDDPKGLRYRSSALQNLRDDLFKKQRELEERKRLAGGSEFSWDLNKERDLKEATYVVDIARQLDNYGELNPNEFAKTYIEREGAEFEDSRFKSAVEWVRRAAGSDSYDYTR